MWLVIAGGLIKDFIFGPASALTIAISKNIIRVYVIPIPYTGID